MACTGIRWQPNRFLDLRGDASLSSDFEGRNSTSLFAMKFHFPGEVSNPQQ